MSVDFFICALGSLGAVLSQLEWGLTTTGTTLPRCHSYYGKTGRN